MSYKPDDYLKLKDIEIEFDISRTTVYRIKKSMELFPRFRSGLFLGGKRIRFKELEEFMQYIDTPEYKQELNKLKAVIK
ncbi:helix-turn-helix transcriptional regulator [Lactococcus garvieae]|uniref:helix-turn-helix transcriptional regulator n=1 Tax=Lactococcus garvieae TaxID=1363 RepID=UPI0013FDA4E3|nr:DNA-binding protein [Lactococcus garvieae]UKS67710.1 DNA-binding protein [Lactococcus garvieae]USI66408.1 DNA-binding protein [Lactococcus petauri]